MRRKKVNTSVHNFCLDLLVPMALTVLPDDRRKRVGISNGTTAARQEVETEIELALQATLSLCVMGFCQART